MGIMKKPTHIAGKMAYYGQRLEIAIGICRDNGLEPTEENIKEIMGEDYYDLLKTRKEYEKLKTNQ